MTTITCDCCGKKINNPLKITFWDGESPHNGSTMYKISDLCVDCADLAPLKCDMEWDDFVKGKGKRK